MSGASRGQHRVGILVVCGLLGLRAPVAGQDASFVHRLGRDTMAVEQYTRTANRLAGEVAARMGAAVTRIQYDVALNDGRPVTAIYRLRSAAGTPLPNQPTEVRITFVGDSAKREAVFADSTNVRMVSAARGVPFQSPAFGLWELAFMQMRKSSTPSANFTLVTAGGGTAQVALAAAGGDTIRSTNAAGLATIFRADREGRLLSVDATQTTQKLVSTRGNTRIDVAALAGRMSPTGALSARGTAHASFMQSVVFISYGRPLVRERTVWGGTLVPTEQIWRAGANEATHLATGRELTFGNVVLPPGLYTLFIFNASSGPQLVINKQVGQWGTVYNQEQDFGRVPMTMSATPEHVEEFTINIRSLGGGRGSIDLVWGQQMASTGFTVR
ncbi:MAG: DUF2911 domain-containing protein [Longimicrobiales bacterium]